MVRVAAPFALILLAACHADPGGGSPDAGPPATWSRPQSTGAPVHRDFGASVVADEAHGRLILFGGAQATGAGRNNLNDVWVLTGADGTAGAHWIELSIPGTKPPPRDNHGAVYDAASNRMIVFGGCAGGCSPTLNDVWVLSNANGASGVPAWTQLSPGGPQPGPRLSFALAYDPGTNRLILFGGHNGAGTVPGNTYPDVLALSNANGQGGTPSWSQISPSGAPPPGQYGPAAAFDLTNTALFIIGGTGADGATDGVHRLSNLAGTGGTAAWSVQVPSGSAGSPPPVFGNPAFFDAPRARVVLVAPSGANGALQQWNLTGSTWTRRAAANAGPSNVGVLGAGWFPARQRLVVLTNAPAGSALWALE